MSTGVALLLLRNETADWLTEIRGKIRYRNRHYYIYYFYSQFVSIFNT